MKKVFALLVVSGLLILSVSGCDANEASSSAAPENASEASAVNSTTTSTEKAPQTSNLPLCSTTRRRPLTSRIATKTSLVNTNANCTYPTISFTVGATVRERDETFTEDFHGQVVTSKAQLDTLALGAEYGTEHYTEQYFEDKALVVLEFRLTSGSIRLQVDTVGVNGNTMTVFYTTVRPNPFSNDMAYHRILLEIDRKQVERVNTVVGYEDQICSHISNPTVF